MHLSCVLLRTCVPNHATHTRARAPRKMAPPPVVHRNALQLFYYRYCLWTGLYSLSSAEAAFFNSIVLLVIALSVWGALKAW